MEDGGCGIDEILCRLSFGATDRFSNQNPLATVGELAPGVLGVTIDDGILTSLKALAPQLMRRANGLVGEPWASPSSTAFSSNVDALELTDETEPRRAPKPVGGLPPTEEELIRRCEA